MAIECYAGETYRITAQDLRHATEGAVTTGAVVTIVLYNPDGTTASTNVATAMGDDWSYDLTMPATAGQYSVKITAVKSAAVGKSKFLVTVKGF